MLAQLSTIARFTLIEALRNRLMWLLAIILLAGLGLSGFLQQLAITESRQIQTALLAAFLRLSAVFLVATFVITSMVREFNDKGPELVLALPLPRAGYALGKLFGFALLALLVALAFGALSLCFSPWQASLIWTISLICELWIIAAFSLLCAFSFHQIMSALAAVLAFYALTRSISALQLIATGPLSQLQPSQQLIQTLLEALAHVLPNLDQFTRTEWLVYHNASLASLSPLLQQTCIYLVLLMSAAVFDLYRKNI